MILPENFRVLFYQPPWMPCKNYVFTIRQRFAKTLKCLATHQNDFPDGLLLEPPETLRQMPRDFVARANHAVQRHRGDGFEMFHLDEIEFTELTKLKIVGFNSV